MAPPTVHVQPSFEVSCSWEAERPTTRGKLDGSVVLDQE